ncbi:MAG: DUF4870 domain-containing protein [Phycisphaeraceae bacterium]
MEDQTNDQNPATDTASQGESDASTDTGQPTKDEINMGMLAHLLGIFTGFLGPLIIWLVKKDESAYISDASKESLNFQITMLFIYVGLGVFSCITLGFGAILFFPIWIAAIVFMILATIKSTKGELYRYPVCIRLVK